MTCSKGNTVLSNIDEDIVSETNVAATLHDIAVNQSKPVEDIILKCQKAANKGKLYLEIKISQEEYNNYWKHPQSALVEKIKSLGFDIDCYNEEIWWRWGGYVYYFKIKW